MAGIDIYTDPTGVNDIVLDEKGDFRWTQTRQESLTQQVRILLTTWLGEWSFNLEFGTPYKQRLLVGNLTESEINSEIKRVILDNIDDITAVTSVVTEFDRSNRILALTVEVYCDNETIEIPIANPHTKLNTYPEPRSFEDFVICSLDPETASLESINTLHYHLNYELPDYGSSTWWNTWVN